MMTLQQLSEEYFRSSELLDTRIQELLRQRKELTEPSRIRQMDIRLRILREMRQDARAIGKKLAHYYD